MDDILTLDASLAHWEQEWPRPTFTQRLQRIAFQQGEIVAYRLRTLVTRMTSLPRVTCFLMFLACSRVLKDKALITQDNPQRIVRRIKNALPMGQLERRVYIGIVGVTALCQAGLIAFEWNRIGHKIMKCIRNGTFPLSQSKCRERVVRVICSKGNAQSLALKSFGIGDAECVVPFYHSPERCIEALDVEDEPESFVPNGISVWDAIQPEASWLLKPNPKLRGYRTVLLLEVDTSTTHDLFSSFQNQLNISIQQICSHRLAFQRRIRNAELRENVTCVVLADQRVTYSTGGGHVYLLREANGRFPSVDIFLNPTAIIGRKMLRWYSMTSVPEDDNEVVFETDSKDFFLNAQRYFRMHKIKVIDANHTIPTHLPKIVCYTKSEDTLNAIQTCESIASIKTLAIIDEIPSRWFNICPVISTALEYDNAFREVRSMLRDGIALNEIQRRVDERD
eukprot:PhF_6_TR24978/c0_g1_i1/m.34372